MTRGHSQTLAGRWHSFSLAEQLGNIGSEVYRALRWRGHNQRSYQNAIDRALELLDLTLADGRWNNRKELARVREVLCDFFVGDNQYRSDAHGLQTYFDQFALAAKLEKPAD